MKCKFYHLFYCWAYFPTFGLPSIWRIEQSPFLLTEVTIRYSNAWKHHQIKIFLLYEGFFQTLHINDLVFIIRLQLEERLAQEARERRQDERIERRAEDKRAALEEYRARASYNDLRKSPNEDRARDQVQFILGGDKWVGTYS